MVQLESLSLAGESPARPPAPPKLPTPCSGALCSGSPAVPHTPAPNVPQRAEPWGFLPAVPAAASEPGSTSSPFNDGPLHPVHRGLVVFHPPRPSRPMGSSGLI